MFIVRFFQSFIIDYLSSNSILYYNAQYIKRIYTKKFPMNSSDIAIEKSEAKLLSLIVTL